MNKTITVGISDLNVVKDPDILVTYALGSCVGICLYDKTVRLAGLAHIMLPSSKLSSNIQNTYKFADTGIAALVKKMEQMGARPALLKAKIAGGAKMFAAMSNSSIANIGERNVLAVKQTLATLHIQIIAEDTGKDYGRTVYFSGEDGSMRIKSVNHGESVW